jgi:UDP-N-acetylmuramoyl-tripeptide--D-alanyl-D-alanine ligase
MAIRDGAMAFVNADDPWLNNMSKRLTRKKTFSLNDHTADVYLRISEEMPELVFDIYANYKLIGNTRSNLGGLFNGYNIAAAITVGLHYEVSITEIIQGISQYVSTMNRSQWIHTKDDQHILLDAYNANPSSMNAGIESFSKIKESKALFLGDMLELGKHAIIEHQAIYDKAVSLGYEEIFLVGKHFKEALPQYPFVFDHTAALLAWLDLHPIKARYIYIKGSRGIAMEQCLDYFNL